MKFLATKLRAERDEKLSMDISDLNLACSALTWAETYVFVPCGFIKFNKTQIQTSLHQTTAWFNTVYLKFIYHYNGT